MARLNKKILCFVDEYGTAGSNGFALGCVLVWSRECGKADKALSDLLPKSAGEIHASAASPGHIQGLLSGFVSTPQASGVIMINRLGDGHAGTRPQIYAKALVETAKTGIRMFAKRHGLVQIGNVEVIVDLNDQNTSAEFAGLVDDASRYDGIFKAVRRVSPIDSSASRILQLADLVAHSRSWIHKSEENAKGLKDKYKIVLI